MSGTETMTDEPAWTKANLRTLLAAMKTSIPKRDRKRTYFKGLILFDWKEVAFPPFSPEACKEKWGEIMKKMMKIRTLTELIVEAEDVISNPIQNLRIHPEHPKRPRPPNAIFFEENWSKFNKKQTRMSQAKLFTHLSKEYQLLPDEEKAQYVDKFKLEVEEYKKKMEKFNKQHTKKRLSADCTDDEEQTEDAKCLPAKPPFNGYNIFCKEQRSSMTGFAFNAYSSVWAVRWRNLTEEERKTYCTRCKELKREYSTKLNEYLNTFDEEEQQKILKENDIKRPKVQIEKKTKKYAVRKVAKKLPGEPKKPTQAGNAMFCKKQMALLKETIPNSRERFAKINQLWCKLSNEEKYQYKEDARKNMDKYYIELQAWFMTSSKAEQEAYRICNPSKYKYIRTNIKPCVDVYRPSDSEDEELEDSSSDEEDYISYKIEEGEEEEEEEVDDIISFKVY
ncbi:nucleolar transcription factor 1-A-like [Cottoperca gobio]|uniref:Nucleolar transcription factor 1-A-like n=1 Tax=Cottoperca gobio TaxID=56716 RepID=A0A6J2RN19_COTGO|nr:nucleolar transcription factor 1-A-like [Cottoperca gobio]